MPKTVPAGAIEMPWGATFQTNVVPDPFDERDLLYRPRLQPLPPALDQRAEGPRRHVFTQEGNSCTGHALATMINAVLAERVSPYMLYRLARRYDEFPGEADAGSSLRGALKGWFHHGVLREEDWPALDMDAEPDLYDDAVALRAAERPLGAFYRVNPFRIDDMQSAINELKAVCASAVVHDGWVAPQVVERDGVRRHVIMRATDAAERGGHAFALVGYDRVGFLVQNSWGPEWGDGGYATLPYEDWLQSAYDAWVARPGVPMTPLAGGWSRTVQGTDARLVTGAGPDLRRLAAHVVNLGNDGRLSTSGAFVSTPAQLARIFDNMRAWHDRWARQERGRPVRIVLYAHGGLTNEKGALAAAEENLNWWMNNRVYPLFFVWQTGPTETLLGQLTDLVRFKTPAALGFDLMEGVDRLVENIARANLRWMWDEMKENARAASQPITDASDPPGASLTVARLRDYLDGRAAEVSLVGHSAGSIFHAALLQRLVDAGIDVASMALLAPAIRLDEFRRDILPHVGGAVRRFTVFNLSDQRELDDTCGTGSFDVYRKSILYLVARALERGASGAGREVPLLGMQRHLVPDVLGEITGRGGVVVSAPSLSPQDRRSDATGHAGMAREPLTMTSVLLRLLGRSRATAEMAYRPNAALRDSAGPGPAPAAQPAPAAAAHHAGSSPLVETAEPQHGRPRAAEPGVAPVEVADAPRSGRRTLDMLLADGYELVGDKN